MKNKRFVWASLLLGGALASLALAQNPELQQKVEELKQSAAANKQALAQYTWVETVTISLKGEQKKQEHFQVRLGPDGKPQKQSLDQPAPVQAADSGGRRGGRLKEHVVEKKTDEYKEYANSIKSLIEQYVPPEKSLIEQARQAGNIALSPAPGNDGEFQLALSNYVKQGDKMTIVIDKVQKAIVSVSINSYLDDPKDAVTAQVQFSAVPGGPSHVSAVTINGVSKELTIAIQNGSYQHL